MENCASALWPENVHAAVSLPDGRRGEQIILVTDAREANRAALWAWARNHGVPECAVPRSVIFVDSVPVLGTGKPDYAAVTTLALTATSPDIAARA